MATCCRYTGENEHAMDDNDNSIHKIHTQWGGIDW